MATIRAKLLDNLQHKLHPNCNYMITRFGLLICSAFFILITLLILLTTTNTSTPTLYTSSIVSWSYNLPNTSLYSSSVRNSSTLLPNLTKSYDLGNFSKEEKKSHLENLDFLVKNVSFFGQESRKGDIFTVSSEKNGVGLGQIDAELGQLPNFTKSFDLGNFSRKTHLGNPDFLVKNVSFLGQESRKGDIFNVSSGKNEVGLGQIDGRLGQLHKDEVGFRSIKCDIFDGKWVKDERMPHYPPGSCPFVDNDFNCHINRRPDHDFYRWKWQPHQCNIPRLNATDFLERMRGRKLVFVGDSLNRNMWESLVCILRHSVKDKRRVHEISGKREFKKEGFYAFRFEDYNCTIDYVRAPFLVREWTFQGENGPLPTLRLDLMDQTTKMYHDADILIFNTGHWWTHEKTSRGEDYYQEGNHLHPRLKVLQAYGRALRTWGRWVDRLVDPKKTLVFFRGYSGTHFRGGQWNSGGQCHKETEPIFNETYLGKYPSKMRVLEQVMQKMKTPVMYLNISRLTDYRKDAHPSIYRKSYKNAKELIEAEQSQDCSHWCLPGVPDIWNELLYASLLKAGLKPVNP